MTEQELIDWCMRWNKSFDERLKKLEGTPTLLTTAPPEPVAAAPETPPTEGTQKS